MSNVNILNLPVAVSLSGGESVPLVQGGVTKRAAANLFATLTALPSIANNTMLANTSGSTAAPVSTTQTLMLDTIGSTQGDILFRAASAWVRLAAGTSGQVLKTLGAGANPVWGAAAVGASGSDTQIQFNTAGALDANSGLTYVQTAGLSTLNVGVAGATVGAIGLTGSTSGSVTIKTQAVAGTYNFNLPTTAGTSGQPLLSGGGSASPMTFGTLGVAGGGTGAATLTNHGVLIGAGTSALTALAAAAAGTLLAGVASSDPAFTATPTLGIAGTTKGQLLFAGNTSGTVTVQPAAAAGTWSFTWPTSGGTSGYLLSTDGAGVTSWVAPPAAGLTVGSTTISSGTTTRILYDNAGVLGEYTISGSGTVVAMATSPSFTTPTLGVATATSINKMAITAPATSSTLSVADGKTFTASNTLTLTGTDSTSFAFPSVSDTVACLATANTFTKLQTIAQGTANAGILASTGYSLTGANATSMIDLAGTWNTSGTPTAIKLNITNTASNAASLLLDLQVGSASKVKADAVGNITFATGAQLYGPDGSAGVPAYSFTSAAGMGIYKVDSGGIGIAVGGVAKLYLGSEIAFASGSILEWSSTTNATGTPDVRLYRDAAATLALRNSTTAQTFRVYGTWTDASNGDWFSITKAAGGVATLATVANGTGTASTIAVTNSINLVSGTATPAAGSTTARVTLGTTAGFGIYYGSGAPTVSAAQGSIYLRSDGSGIANRLYVNTDGATTWTNFVTAA